MQTQSSIGSMPAAEFWKSGFSEMYAFCILSFFTHQSDLHQSCTQLPNGAYTKNLAIVEQDLSRDCLRDNSPISYGCNEGEHDSPYHAVDLSIYLEQKMASQ
jgi:TFIIF-interacting CTD phosphatase-like protein